MTGYTTGVRKASEYTKITISVRNDVAARARRRAKELGTSQSAWFTSVAERELDASESSTDYIARINATVSVTSDDTTDFARIAARRTLETDDTPW
jgi:hypothetical protein